MRKRITLKRYTTVQAILLTVSVLACVAAPASAPVEFAPYQSSPTRVVAVERNWGPWLGPFRRRLVPSLMQDFGERYLYAAANLNLPKPKQGERRVVFLGDSITDRWNLETFFPNRPYVNRGIGSQVTAQMLVRFEQDVVSLRPSAVFVLAGVNDVQGFIQAPSAAEIEANWRAMADMADANGIRVIFGSILPVNNYDPGSEHVVAERRPEELRLLNTWLAAFCRSRGYGYADFQKALIDRTGLMRRGLTEDGVHPRPEGYAIMAPIAEKAIDEAFTAR